MRPTRSTIVPAVLATALVFTAACGDDDDETGSTDEPSATTSTRPSTTTVRSVASAPPTDATRAPEGTAAGVAGGADTIDPADAEYCAAVAEMSSSGAPTAEQIRTYQAVAPEELQEPIELVLDALEAGDGDFTAVFSDPAAGEALEQITAVETERCGGGDEGPPQDPMVTVIDEEADRIDVTAREYAFDAELPTAAGRYSFVLTNDGEQPHLMILIRLEDGAVLDEVLAAEGETGVAEEFESSPAAPGGEGVLTADLGPGQWVLLCPLPGPEGHPHFVDGMLREFTIA